MKITEETNPNAWYLDHNFRVGSTGFKVKTYTGKVGITHHNKDMVNGKMQVHIKGQPLAMLCDPDTLTLIEIIEK